MLRESGERHEQERDQQAVERLAHARCVGGDEHRVHRGQRGGEQRRAGAGDAPAQQPDHRHRARSQHAPGQPVDRRAGASELRYGRQEVGPQRWVGGRGRGHMFVGPLVGLDVAVSAGDQICRRVEEPHVGGRGRRDVIAADRERVGDPHRERTDDHESEPGLKATQASGHGASLPGANWWRAGPVPGRRAHRLA